MARVHVERRGRRNESGSQYPARHFRPRIANGNGPVDAAINAVKEILKKKVRIEQQALAYKSLSFVADEYLPGKIEEGDCLP